MPTILTARLPVRFNDTLGIEVDADADGQTLTPAQAMALGERLIHLAAHRRTALRRAGAAVPVAMLAKAGAVA